MTLIAPRFKLLYSSYTIQVNNLYGLGLQSHLPVGGFQWIKEESELHNLLSIVETLYEKGEMGYLIDCDLSVPNHHHDKLNDYPPYPSTFKVYFLSIYAITLTKKYTIFLITYYCLLFIFSKSSLMSVCLKSLKTKIIIILDSV